MRWRVPENNGGSPVTHYVIQLRKRSAGNEKWDGDFIAWETNVPDVEHVVVDLVAYSFEYCFRFAEKFCVYLILITRCSFEKFLLA